MCKRKSKRFRVSMLCALLCLMSILPNFGEIAQAAEVQIGYVTISELHESGEEQKSFPCNHGVPGETVTAQVKIKTTAAMREDTTFRLNVDIGDTDVLMASDDSITVTIPRGRDYITTEFTFYCKKEGISRYIITDMDNTMTYASTVFYVRTPGVYPSSEIYLTPEHDTEDLSCVLPDGSQAVKVYSSDTSVVKVENNVLTAKGNGTANLYFLPNLDYIGWQGAMAAIVYVTGFEEEGTGDWVTYGSLSASNKAFVQIRPEHYTAQNNLSNELSSYLEENRIVEPVGLSDLSWQIYIEGSGGSTGSTWYSWDAPISDETYAYLSKNIFPYMGIYKAQDSFYNEAGYSVYNVYELNNFCKEAVATIDNGGLTFDRESGKVSVSSGCLMSNTEYILMFDHSIIAPNDAVLGMNIYFRFRTMSVVDSFVDMVNQITEVTCSDSTKEYLDRCEAEYESMTEDELMLEEVKTAREKLTGYEAIYQTMMNICAIGTVTADSGEIIGIAQLDYDALTEEQRAVIPDDIYQILLDAEARYEYLNRIQIIMTEKESYTVVYGSAGFRLEAETTGDGALSYTSDNSDIVKVDNNGNVIICGAGTAIVTIQASATENFDSALKKVRITVQKATPVITVGTEYNNTSFSLNASASNGISLKYASSDETVAKVDAAGVVTVIGAGTVTITIQTGVNVNYNSAVKKIVYHFNPQTASVYPVGKLKYKVTNSNIDGAGTVSVIGASNKTITSLTIPATVKIAGNTYKVTSIGANAFKGYKKLKTVTIGKNVTKIGASAFRSDTKLQTVTIGQNVTKIGASAFRSDTKLQTVTIGKNVTTIGASAFRGDKKLTVIKIKTTKLKKIPSTAFKNIKKKAVFKVPSSKKKAYKKLLKGRDVR